MTPKNLKQARIDAEEIFKQSLNKPALTTKGEEYKNGPPKTRYLIYDNCFNPPFYLTHRIPFKPKDPNKDYKEKYVPLCTIKDYDLSGLGTKGWDILIDTLMEYLEELDQ